MQHGGLTLKVGDFGISQQMKYESEQLRTVNERGFPPYVAIEIYQKKPYTTSADVWSMGCILYELIHGKRLITLGNVGPMDPRIVVYNLRKKVLAYDLRSIKATCLPEIREIILNCVSQYPEDRPTSGQMLDEFTELHANFNQDQTQQTEGKPSSQRNRQERLENS